MQQRTLRLETVLTVRLDSPLKYSVRSTRCIVMDQKTQPLRMVGSVCYVDS